MQIRNEAKLRDYAASHPEAAGALRRWAELAKQARWQSPAQTRRTLPHADQVCECTVFNLKGNHYRLITRINYGLQVVTLVNFLTHKQYDRNKWKKDCGC